MTKADGVVLREYVEGDLDKIVRLDERCFDEEFRSHSSVRKAPGQKPANRTTEAHPTVMGKAK